MVKILKEAHTAIGLSRLHRKMRRDNEKINKEK